MGEQMFMKKSEVVGQSVVSDDLVQSVGQNIFLKDGASQLQKFHVNFHRFHALYCTRLSQLG
jgi:hypothetical protein